MYNKPVRNLKFYISIMNSVSVLKTWSVLQYIVYILMMFRKQVVYVIVFVSNIRVASLEEREYLMDRLEFVRNQLNLLIEDIKKKIKMVLEQVASQVETIALLQEVRYRINRRGIMKH